MWHAIAPSDAPADRDLRLAVITCGEVHALVFPCCRNPAGWVDASSGRLIALAPTYWAGLVRGVRLVGELSLHCTVDAELFWPLVPALAAVNTTLPTSS